MPFFASKEEESGANSALKNFSRIQGGRRKINIFQAADFFLKKVVLMYNDALQISYDGGLLDRTTTPKSQDRSSPTLVNVSVSCTPQDWLLESL